MQLNCYQYSTFSAWFFIYVFKLEIVLSPKELYIKYDRHLNYKKKIIYLHK